ncbi:sterol desaturase family protein [Psychromonas sp. B3M02]|uniref:sterol desaturase family protein n=1 Tax=Psychromonas sp. B3M02 TaxID=2267226 RepID=UPI00215D6013|nr:sterol desaturase family protein [Psychromonas sp. B3M02]
MVVDDALLRLIVFVSILAVMFTVERLFPARQLSKEPSAPSQKMRLTGNFGIVFLSGLSARLVFPLGLMGLALFFTEQKIGLFNIINLPEWLVITLSLLLLDMLIYWQHRLFHKIPVLWQLHKVHHADTHVDSSTGLRFHPIEIIASLAIKGLAIFLLGIPAFAVILFEVLLNGFAIFNHANIRLPAKVEAVTRLFLMTQILHRIHHSQLFKESNSNYGFSVIWWDRLFGSYSAEATKPDLEIDIGISEFPEAKDNAHLWGLLVMPFKRKK